MWQEAKEEEGRQGQVKTKVRIGGRYMQRGVCSWCHLEIGTYDYWFWWLRRFHRVCRKHMAEHPKEAR